MSGDASGGSNRWVEPQFGASDISTVLMGPPEQRHMRNAGYCKIADLVRSQRRDLGHRLFLRPCAASVCDHWPAAGRRIVRHVVSLHTCSGGTDLRPLAAGARTCRRGARLFRGLMKGDQNDFRLRDLKSCIGNFRATCRIACHHEHARKRSLPGDRPESVPGKNEQGGIMHPATG